MLVSICHVTRYAYDDNARYTVQSLRLTPPSFGGQKVITWKITAPGIEKATTFYDAFHNYAHLTSISGDHSKIEIRAEGIVETEDRAGIVRGVKDYAPLRVYLRETATTAADDKIRELSELVRKGSPVDGLHALMHTVRDRVEYQTGVTGSHTSAAEALAAGKGVCQDHAHIFITAARLAGIPARYVNGYFLAGADEPAEAHHAWAEAYVEGLGWVGFDPTNRICPTDRYIRRQPGWMRPQQPPFAAIGGAVPRKPLTFSSKFNKQTANSKRLFQGGEGMTYAVAMRLERGLVFAADTRTNAGVDNIAQYRKLHSWRQPGERVLVLLTAGNLAVTQSVVSLLNEQLAKNEPDTTHLYNAPNMYRAARVVGDAVREARRIDGPALEATKLGFSASIILGGQIGTERPRLFQIYSEGNFIEATDDTPFLQVGEHKYGKPILDRVARADMRLGEAAKLMLLSFDSTLRSNLSVGMPIDILVYERDSLDVRREKRIYADDEYFKNLSSAWSEALRTAFSKIDEFKV